MKTVCSRLPAYCRQEDRRNTIPGTIYGDSREHHILQPTRGMHLFDNAVLLQHHDDGKSTAHAWDFRFADDVVYIPVPSMYIKYQLADLCVFNNYESICIT